MILSLMPSGVFSCGKCLSRCFYQPEKIHEQICCCTSDCPFARPRYPSLDVSFNYLVGKCRKHRGYLETECPRGLEINDELELDRLVDRQIARLVTFEDSASINADLAISISKAYAITYQPTRNSIVAKLIDGRQPELRASAIMRSRLVSKMDRR